MWICHESTHLGSVDEYLDEFLDTRRRLKNGVALEELFAEKYTGQSQFVSASGEWRYGAQEGELT